ncbi:MAG: hypothetical protein JXB47_08230 [Anaerolineae bacterium]|nr:hypothetical protein [Anaerolineae bacterium]
MSERFEDQYLDVLQNIEFAIVSVYHENPGDLADFHVDNVLSSLIRLYRSEQRGRATPQPVLRSPEQELFDAVYTTCEWRLGRAALSDIQPAGDGPAVGIVTETEEALEDGPRNTLDEILACLKRVRKSVQSWTKHGGRKGYLEYVEQFIR